MQDESYTHYKDFQGVKRKRPLFTNGIPDLKIEHNELTDEQIKEQPFQDFLPYGSLVVIDEAQRLFPTRSAAAKVPPYIEALARHRHNGLDIVFITQHPSFLDSFVRRLVQRHMHISIKPVGRKLYEWNECMDQPESSQSIARAIEVNFTLPKEAFGMYKSAEIHTKPKRRLPKSLIFLIFFLPALLGYGWYTYTRMSAKFMQQENAEVVSTETPDNGQNPQTYDQSKGGQNYKTADNGKANLQNGQNLTPEMFVPTIPERVESKPIYNSIRQVQQYERLAACIDGGKLKRSKNDKQDAKTIAEFCEEKSRKLKTWKPKNQTEKELQSITRYIARLKQQKASETVKRQTASDNIKDLIDETIDYLGRKIKEAEGRLKTYINQNPELKQKANNLTTIPGVGIQTASIIMAALSGNNDLKTAKQFTAYLGLDPAEYKSGTSVKGKDRISKVGDCITRAALFSPALVAYRIGTFPRLVANMRQNGKHIMQILTAIMRKLTVVAYTLHKTDTTFEKQRHTRIQQKAA